MKEIKAPKLVAANEENMSISTELFEKTKKRIDEYYRSDQRSWLDDIKRGEL